MVGPTGEVIGVDRAAAAVETAKQRAQDAGIGNVTFAAGDLAEMPFQEPFDAVVGRLVLMHQPDPVPMLRILSRLLRPGGILAFQEFDISGAHSLPQSQTYEQCVEWIGAALNAMGTDIRMGLKLYSAFTEAGLP
jgi:ubiquinone/menaquinone biosynthesis C-methylase UbiE